MDAGVGQDAEREREQRLHRRLPHTQAWTHCTYLHGLIQGTRRDPSIEGIRGYTPYGVRMRCITAAQMAWKWRETPGKGARSKTVRAWTL